MCIRDSVDTVPKLDVCGVCDGLDMTCVDCTSFVDCNGDCGGTALLDACGICGGDSSSCTGCLDVHACNLNVYATINDRTMCTFGTMDNTYVKMCTRPAHVRNRSSFSWQCDHCSTWQ